VWAVGARADGLGIRADARVVEIDPGTGRAWFMAGAEHAPAFSRHCLHAVRATQVQLAALDALIRAVTPEEVSEAEAVQRLWRPPHGVWAALDPRPTGRITLALGARTLAMAPRVGHHVVQVFAPGCTPLLLPEGFTESTTALRTP
jgi:hypothetical protein